MRFYWLQVLMVCATFPMYSQVSPEGPTSKKAQESYQQGLNYVQHHEWNLAISYFRQANKQDSGHCLVCQEQMIQSGLQVNNWKAVEEGARSLTTEVKEPKQQAVAHHFLGLAYFNEGMDNHDNDLFARAHDEFTNSIAASALPDAIWQDGKALAQLHKDDDAKAQFQKFVALTPAWASMHWRAQQFISKPDLARANMVEDFAILSADGQRVSPRDLAGKVVLVHFWSTTCGTCARAFPRLRDIARKLQKQPFVMLSVSVDHDERAWRTFLEKNDVPGLQYRDGFNGPMAKVFGVGIQFHSSVDKPIAGAWQTSWGLKEDAPKTFTIDADGILQSEKLSDSLEGRLQALISHIQTSAASK